MEGQGNVSESMPNARQEKLHDIIREHWQEGHDMYLRRVHSQESTPVINTRCTKCWQATHWLEVDG